jgi:cytochrome c oxidase assembly factor 6
VADVQKRKRLADLEKEGAVQMEVTSQFAGSSSAAKPAASLGDIQDRLSSAKKR